MQIQISCSTGRLPTKKHAVDAGWDLYSIVAMELEPGDRAVIPTGIAMAIPVGYYGRIAERSGMGAMGLGVGAGVIDASYRGEIKVAVYNRSRDVISITPEKAIAQIIFERCDPMELVQVETLDETVRGSNGFGSSDERV